MTVDYGKGQAQRTCAAADRTGHAMLHTMYGQALRHSAEFYIEFFAIDLIMDDQGTCRGVIALSLEMALCIASALKPPFWRPAATAGSIIPAPVPTPRPAMAAP